MSTRHAQLIVIGSGPAGCTAAIYAARANLSPLLIHGMQPGGQLTITSDVENYPGFAHAVKGPWLMDEMHKQAEHCGTQFAQDHINKVELDRRPFRLYGDSGTVYTCDALIIATGASAKWLGLPAEKEFAGRGVSGCATCDGAFFRNQDVMVVGGGNTAMEEALYLANLCRSVTIVHRRDSFRGEKVLQDRVKNHPKIRVIWDSALENIKGGGAPTGGVEAGVLRNLKTNAVTDVPVTGIFIAIGHQPNTSIFKGILPMDETGYLAVPPGSVSTPIPGVFAAGDVADKVYRQAVTAAGLGCMAALDAVRFLESQPHHAAA